MLIENRHKKPYSEKLFNELCIVCLLMDSNNILDSYVLDRRFGVSKRTLYRYIEDINEACPPLNLHFEGKTKHKYLCADIPEEYDKYELSLYISDIGHENRIKNDRLWRCMQLLACNYGGLDLEKYIDEDDLINIPSDDRILINGERYVFVDFFKYDELYEKTSLRTQQRDVRLVKDVLVKMTQGRI